MLPYNRTLPTACQRDRFEIVLVAPRNPLNIGAAARAMANFGFSRLAVVAPYQPHWREAQSAVGAEDLLRTARVCATLQEALSDCSLVLGTATLNHRAPEQPVVHLPDLVPLLGSELSRSAGRVALVFGPEKRGLTREDLGLCHRLVVIPTAPRQPSMNLGQAVAVCLYELASRLPALEPPTPQPAGAAGPSHLGNRKNKPPTDPTTLATSAAIDRLAAAIEETMQAAGYSPAAMRAANRHDLDLLLRRIRLSTPDATRILGLFRRVLWRLRK